MNQFHLKLRERTESEFLPVCFSVRQSDQTWNPVETALIVCDMWDVHYCLNATRRIMEMAPRVNEVLELARNQGAVIIHAPSNCTQNYLDHPSRIRALEAPEATNLPDGLNRWSLSIPAEKKGQFPLDREQDGCDDDPVEHQRWKQQLEQAGRRSHAPWVCQCVQIRIDPERDYLSETGDQIWNILELERVQNLIYLGVHVNACVLARSFGLRQMVWNGKQVTLMRDLTDSWYDPAKPPFLNHFTATDLVVEHIEKYVCPTITSDQLLGGNSFRFEQDQRPEVAIIWGNQQACSSEQVQMLSQLELLKDFSATSYFPEKESEEGFPGLEQSEADLIVMVGCRHFARAEFQRIQQLAEEGKSFLILGVSLLEDQLEVTDAGRATATRPNWFQTIMGVSCFERLEHSVPARVVAVPGRENHPQLSEVDMEAISETVSVSCRLSLSPAATSLLIGREREGSESPLLWVMSRQNGGRSVCFNVESTQLSDGNVGRQLLKNAVVLLTEKFQKETSHRQSLQTRHDLG